MLKNYITIALRNLKRQMMYSSINIIGLAVGMACSLVIFLFVYGEWSHDRHFENGDRIHRIGISFFNMGPFANGPELLGEFLPAQFGGIERITRFKKNPQELIAIEEQAFKETVYYVDSTFFQVFSYPFVEGDPANAVAHPSTAVLTESMAMKYFKDKHALGKTIVVGKERLPYVVTGIVKDDLRKSHLKASVWLSWRLDPTKKYHWTSASVFTYVLLHENSSEHELRNALEAIVAKQVYPKFKETSLDEYLKSENRVKFFTHPLKDIYLKSKYNLELSAGGNETNLYIFSLVAFFILILAAVNFINLSTARATRRAKEVGIRKSLGTSRVRLITQFLLESVIICLFSMALALCLAELFTFAFFWVTGQQLSINLWSNVYSLLAVLIFAIAVGVLAGIYPALYLTAFQPAKVLKGNMQVSSSQRFRHGLVVFQFVISTVLIICSGIIIRQLNFMATKDLGFNQENVVTIDNLYEMGESAVAFKDELSQQPGVTHASLHAGEPGSKAIIAFYTYRTPSMTEDLTINTYFADQQYLDAMGFTLLKGRNFDMDLASDSSSVILNESALQALNISGDPIGAEVNKGQRVIGVVRDFHWESLRSEIAPIAIIPQQKQSQVAYAQLAIRMNSGDAAQLLKFAEQRWKSIVIDEPMEYHFLDENFGELIKKEAVLGKAIGLFTVMAILISCLGLFGLAAYTIDQRTREIGIRKVLGATVGSIVLMLNKQFVRLVLTSIVIAIPVTYFAADAWLSGFAYRTNLSAWIFIAGGCLGLVITLLTVAFHSVKAAQTNPAETLKCE
jgi:putative ABC transport system permease protein